MTHTIRFETHIEADRRMEIVLPDEVELGSAQVTIQVVQHERKVSTAADLLASDIVGMYADREDIGDPVDFAHKLRERAWKRAS